MNERSFVRRRGRPDDYPAFARLFREIEAEHPIPSRETWERELAVQSIMLEEQGEVIGFAEIEVFRDRAHVHLVAVAPEHRRRGVGREVMEAIVHELRAAQVPSFFLHVREENAAAIALYESVGMKRVGTSVGLRISWERVRALADSEAGTSLAAADRDAAFERAFRLPEGRISRERERGSSVVTLLHDAAPAGLAVRNRDLAIASPVRVVTPNFARALLLALEPHVGGDEVAVALTDDAATEALLLAAGASVLHRAHRYERKV